MNEKKRLMFILLVVIGIVIFVVASIIINNQNSHKMVKTVEKLYNESEINVIYLGRDDCGYCQLFTPVIDDIKEKFNVDYKYINTNKLITTDLEKLLNLLKIDASKFGTPHLSITQNGEVIGEQNGYTDEISLFSLFQEKGLISKDEANPYLASDDNKVVSAFNEVYNSSERRLIYIGRDNCAYCQKIDPIMKEIKEEYNIDYYYINTNELTNQELGTILYKLGKSSSSFGTPYLVITQNGNKIAEQPGYAEKADLIKFLSDNELVRR